MMTLFDYFTHKAPQARKKKQPGSKPFSGKLDMRGTKICPGCPAGVTKKAPELPAMTLPDATTVRETTKVVTLVNMDDYRRKPKGPKGLF